MEQVSLEELTDQNNALMGSATPGLASAFARWTPLQWLICGVAALGFAFDLY